MDPLVDQLPMRGEPEVTVLFLDLRDFTSFVDSHRSYEVFELLDEFYGLVGPIAVAQQATIERFTGDGVMLVFGDRNPCSDHAFQAAQTAISARQAVQALVPAWREAGYAGGMGSGMETGPVVLGCIGFDERRDYAALGRTTSVAARLCERARANEILVGPGTVAKLAGRFPLAIREPALLKGIRKKVALQEIPMS